MVYREKKRQSVISFKHSLSMKEIKAPLTCENFTKFVSASSTSFHHWWIHHVPQQLHHHLQVHQALGVMDHCHHGMISFFSPQVFRAEKDMMDYYLFSGFPNMVSP